MAEGEQVLTTALSVSGELAIEAMKLLAAAIGKLYESSVRTTDKLFDEFVIRRTSAEYKRQTELMEQAKISTGREQLADLRNRYETSESGCLSPENYVKAQQAGVEFVGVPATMSEEDVKDFAKIAEKNGILFTAVAHPDYNGNNTTYYFAFRLKDLPKVEDAFVVLKLDHKLKKLDAEINKAQDEITSCKNEISELNDYIDAKTALNNSELVDYLSDRERTALEEKIDMYERKYGISNVDMAKEHIDKNTSVIYKNETIISTLEKEKTKTLLERRTAEANMCRDVVQEQVVNGYKSGDRKGVNLNKTDNANRTSRNGVTTDFNSAVNRDTQGSNQRVVYICDTANPDHYIVAESKQATFEGKPYLKTEYTIYDGGKSVMVCDDSRFRGKNYNAWAETRKEMRNSLNFSDNVIVFTSKNDLTAYQSRCKGAKSVTEQEKGNAAVVNEHADGKIEYRDYDTIINNLKKSIADRGYTIENNTPINVDTSKSAIDMYNEYKGIDADVCQNAAVCKNLSDQLDVYSKLSVVEGKMLQLDLALMTLPELSEEFEKAKSEMEDLRKQHGELCATEATLSEERASLENANVAVEMCAEEEQNIEERSLAHENESFDISEKDVGDRVEGVSLDKTENTDIASYRMSIEEIQEHFTEKSAALKAEQGQNVDKVLSTKKER